MEFPANPTERGALQRESLEAVEEVIAGMEHMVLTEGDVPTDDESVQSIQDDNRETDDAEARRNVDLFIGAVEDEGWEDQLGHVMGGGEGDERDPELPVPDYENSSEDDPNAAADQDGDSGDDALPAANDGGDDDNGENPHGEADAAQPANDAPRVLRGALALKCRKMANGVRIRVDIPIWWKKKVVRLFLAECWEGDTIYDNDGVRIQETEAQKDKRWMKAFKKLRAEELPKFPDREKDYCINRKSQFQKWINDYSDYNRKRDRDCLRITKRRKSSYWPLESSVWTWFSERRANGDRVTREDLHNWACEQLRTDEELRQMCHTQRTAVSVGWVQKFMRRRRLRVKIVTKRNDLTEAEVCEKAQKWHCHIYRCLRSVVIVLNFDEMPMSVCGSMGKLRTVDRIASLEVRVNWDPADQKRMATVIVIGAVILDGGVWKPLKIDPILLLKGEPKTDSVRNEKYHPGVCVLWTPKGVINQKTMVDGVAPHLKKFIGDNVTLCLMDAATSHISKSSVQELHRLGMYTSIVPARCTSYLQWVDTDVAAPLRQLHLAKYAPMAAAKKTSSEKRKILAKIIALIVPQATRDVVAQFERLGYTDPLKATIKSYPNYKFNPPVLTDQERDNDAAQLNRIIEKAKAAAKPRPKTGKHGSTAGMKPLTAWMTPRNPKPEAS